MEQGKNKENKTNIFVRIITHPIVKTVVFIVVIGAVLIFATLIGLDRYTKHNESIAVPNIKGLQVQAASTVLAAAGLKLEVSDSIYHSAGTPGAILEQVPMPTSHVKKGRTVFLTVQAKSPQLVPIPQLKDFSKRQAIAQLNSLGFNRIDITEVPSQYAGLVLRLTYNGDSIKIGQKIPKGSPLRLVIGKGGIARDSQSSSSNSANDLDVDESFF